MVDPPRLHKQLGAKWVEVTKAVSGVASTGTAFNDSEFENAASNTR
jgi:hypothetical protein